MVQAIQNTWVVWRYLPIPTLRLYWRGVKRHWQVGAVLLTIAACLPISLSWRSQVPQLASTKNVGLSQIPNLAGPKSQPALTKKVEQKPAASVTAPAVAILPLTSSATGLASPPSVTLPAPAKSWYNGYAYGHCTYYVASRRPVPPGWGNARNWYWAAQRAGYKVGVEPQEGAIAWTPRGWFGHVALVEKIDNGKVLIAEMNYVGWNRISRRWVEPSAFKYIY